MKNIIDRPDTKKKIIYKEVEVPKEIPVYKDVEILVERPKYIENIIEKPVPYEVV